MARVRAAVAGPRHGLPDRPPAGALAIEAELGCQPVEAVQHVTLTVPELRRSDDRRDRKLALAYERLRVDDEPRLTLRGQDVVGVEILVQQHLFPLRPRERAERVECGVEQVAGAA